MSHDAFMSLLSLTLVTVLTIILTYGDVNQDGAGVSDAEDEEFLHDCIRSSHLPEVRARVERCWGW
jgi:hypothetical protein